MTVSERPDEPEKDREMEKFRNRAYDSMREMEMMIHLGRMNEILDSEEQNELWDMVNRLSDLAEK